MVPRQEVKQDPKAKAAPRQEPKPKLQIVKLEGRITPGIAVNHNETLVCGPAKAKLQIVKLEGRIAPKLAVNHNETLVGGPAKAKLQIVKLEGRIAPSGNAKIV